MATRGTFIQNASSCGVDSKSDDSNVRHVSPRILRLSDSVAREWDEHEYGVPSLSCYPSS